MGEVEKCISVGSRVCVAAGGGSCIVGPVSISVFYVYVLTSVSSAALKMYYLALALAKIDS